MLVVRLSGRYGGYFPQRTSEWNDRLATQAHYAEHLTEQATSWQRITLLRDYCEALERRISDAPHDDERLDGAREWLAWARRYVAVADPLTNLPVMPIAPEPADADIKPYLGKWSPYGPEAGQAVGSDPGRGQALGLS